MPVIEMGQAAHPDWPPHKREWESFLFEIGDHPEWSQFGNLSELEARRVWTVIEEKLFPAYRMFVRVWPEWYSSGIWRIPFPGCRSAGWNLDPAKHLGISITLQERFKSWQDVYNSHEPGAYEKYDWTSFDAEEVDLTRALKRELGEDIYVEYRALEEVLTDGSTRNWRAILGIPEVLVQKESE